ncbi:MAG: GNAT family N-acetyltransferase [Gemmatimonadota bacterium]
MTIRNFVAADLEACLAVFDSNVPRFFTDEERPLFADFLADLPGPYFVLEMEDGSVGGCGGYAVNAEHGSADLCWGMVRQELHGKQLGRALTERRVTAALDDPDVHVIALNTSQHTRGFYEHLGFEVLEVVRDGYAPGLHRCEMRMNARRST